MTFHRSKPHEFRINQCLANIYIRCLLSEREYELAYFPHLNRRKIAILLPIELLASRAISPH